MQTARLALSSIDKRFGRVRALTNASLAVQPGEFHALLGENGAGKSTLMHIAHGLIPPDAGTIEVDGVPQRFGSPRAASAAGVGLVHQHSTSIAALSVAENLALATGWDVEPRSLRARVAETVARLGLPLDPDADAGSLSVALQQRLEIVKALATDARILLLDEPTAVLTPVEASALFARMRQFTEQGGAVVLITHKLDEALTWADRVTVLRRGVVVASGPTRQQTAASLAEAMVGAPLSSEPPPRQPASVDAPVRVRVAALDVQHEDRVALAVRQAALTVRAGEIVGIAAVEGNGQRELLRAIAGVLPPFRGTLDVAAPVAFIAEDRMVEGLIPAHSLVENLALGLGRAAPWVRGYKLDWRAARQRTEELIRTFDVRTTGAEVPAASLSGGNQQKLVIARALERHPRVIIAENPTRGLDIAATRAVHDRLREAAVAGAAVLVHAGDLDEVLALASRIVVMVGGVASEAPPGADRALVGRMMLGAAA